MGGTKLSRIESSLRAGFKLHDLVVDPVTGIIDGPASRVRLDPKVMNVLVVLAQRAGRIVSRDELLDQVWPGVVVSDDALSRCVYQLRRHLNQAGGDGHHKTLLETHSKRGYRLNCEPTVTSPEQIGEPREARSEVSSQLESFPSSVFIAATAVIAGIVGLAFWTFEYRRPTLPTTNPLAYDAYVRADDYFARSDRRGSLPYAVDLYEEAVSLDPNFVTALVGLARAHTDMYWTGIDHAPSRLESAERALERLSALGVSHPEAHLARANYLLKGLNQFEAALAELDAAEESLARNPELFFLQAMAHRRLGHWDRAIETLDRAIELDSRNLSYLRQQYISYHFVRDFARAQQILNRILGLYPDDGTAYVDMVVLALCRDGDTALARQYAATPPTEFYDEGLAYTYTSWLAAIYDRDYEKALAILDSSAEDPIFDGDLRNLPSSPQQLFYARTHMLAGHEETAQELYLEVVRSIDDTPPARIEDDPRAAAGRYLALAEARAGLGQRELAWELSQRARALIPEAQDALLGTAVQIASVIRILVPAAYDEEALRDIDGYLGNAAGHWSIEGLRKDPRLERIVNSQGFRKLEEKYARSVRRR